MVKNFSVVVHAAWRRCFRHPALLGRERHSLIAGSDNLMPSTLECVRAYCTVGEVFHRFRAVFGVHQEASVI